MDKAAIIKAIKDQRELMQDDASCILDGIDDEERLLTCIDQMIVDRMAILLNLLEE